MIDEHTAITVDMSVLDFIALRIRRLEPQELSGWLADELTAADRVTLDELWEHWEARNAARNGA